MPKIIKTKRDPRRIPAMFTMKMTDDSRKRGMSSERIASELATSGGIKETAIPMPVNAPLIFVRTYPYAAIAPAISAMVIS